MGKRGAKKDAKEYTEKGIQKILRAHFMSPNSMKYRIENLTVYAWESDSLSVTKTGYAYECEIKISRSDFFNDKKKERKHQILEGTYSLKQYEKTYPLRPNYFYYVVPEGLVKPEEVPEFAGLIYITEIYPYVKVEKPAPKICDEKIDEEKLNLKEKFYYNYITWKYKAEEEYEGTIEKLRKDLHESRYDENGTYHKYTLSEANKRVHELESLIKIIQQNSDDYRDQAIFSSGLCNEMKTFMRGKGISNEEITTLTSKYRKEYYQDK